MGSFIILYNFIVLSILLYIAIEKSIISVFSPAAISAFGLIVMYVLRPIYILQTGLWGGAPMLLKSLSGQIGLFNEAMLVSAFFVSAFSFPLIIFLLNHKGVKQNISASKKFIRATEKINKSLFFISFLILAIPFLRGYTIDGYLALLSTRSIMFKTFFGGFGSFVEVFFFLYTSTAVIKIINDMVENKSIIVSTVLVVLVLMLLGGRSNILFFLISIGGAKVYLSKKFNKSYLIYFGFAVFLFGISYRVLTRDLYFQNNKGKDASEVLLETLSRPHEFLVGGFDFVQIDALMTVVSDSRLQKNYLFGSTILACITSPIPRVVWPEKPKGAMTYFTKLYYPGHFEHTEGGELVASWLVEAILNFGSFGILFGGLTMFYFVYLIEKGLGKCGSTLDLAILCIVTPRPFNILKSDLFNNFMAIVKVLFIPFVLKMMFKSKRTASHRPHASVTWQHSSNKTNISI
ncbi:hypothetical protein LZG74_11900 [Dyadobacter sp. CY327]|uniref:hypothetical protein n=1 Tax=Dyadobacter sp. CY327 TaxID=2907301 RepID=UPI001F3C8909|nr:hypothetical protein [Dyadobacter sp. CY327]MCE7071011.1 hypothetical protein [Dyadobacter sp. CY327]